MYSQRALQEYAATSVQTGSPVRLVAMLYEGAMRFLHEAGAAIDRRDYQEKGDRINRAMRIVQELANALDDDAAPELTGQLRSLYEYCEYEMLQASTFNDTRHLRNAVRVLERLHGSWSQLADRNVSAPAAAETSTVEVAPTTPPPPTPWTTQSDEAASEASRLCLSA